MDIELNISDEVAGYVAKKGFDKDYGARPIRRTLQNEVEDVLAEAVLASEISMGDAVNVGIKKDEGKEIVFVQKFTKKE